METCDGIHMIWRARATSHIRFVREAARIVENEKCAKPEIPRVDGSQIRKFYEELTEETHSDTRQICRHNIEKINEFPKSNEKISFNKVKLFRYAVENNVDCICRLDLQSDEINSTDDFGWSALMMATCEGATEAVRILMQLGAKLDIQDKSGRTAYYIAKEKGYGEILNLLENHLRTDELENPVTEEPLTSEPFFCDVCHQNFRETTQQRHLTSTVHQFNMKSSHNLKNVHRFNIPSKNRGLKIMVKQGWNKESGLGPSNSGRLFPIKTVIRKERTGLGIMQNPAKVTHFKPFDLSATKSANITRKSLNKNDIRKEKQREWKRERRLRNALS